MGLTYTAGFLKEIVHVKVLCVQDSFRQMLVVIMVFKIVTGEAVKFKTGIVRVTSLMAQQ